MKTLRAQAGPFVERPFYTEDEIERTCAEELHKIGLLPSKPEPIRIDRFIEKRFGISHEYDELPDGVLGYTHFGKSGVAGIVVARGLEDEGSRSNQRRVRSTLAHEAGHGLFHTHLFVLGGGQSGLFPEGNASVPKVLCRDEGGNGTAKVYSGQWWEFQANGAIGALLVPRNLALIAAEEFLAPAGSFGVKALPAANRRAAAVSLAEVFDVNPIVAAIRLDQLFPQTQEGQQTL